MLEFHGSALYSSGLTAVCVLTVCRWNCVPLRRLGMVFLTTWCLSRSLKDVQTCTRVRGGERGRSRGCWHCTSFRTLGSRGPLLCPTGAGLGPVPEELPHALSFLLLPLQVPAPSPACLLRASTFVCPSVLCSQPLICSVPTATCSHIIPLSEMGKQISLNSSFSSTPI